MILWLAAMAVFFVLSYFLTQRKRTDDLWHRFRQRQRLRRRERPPEEPIDPSFRFDEPPKDGGGESK